MATYKAIALCRVSTKKQRLEGSSLEAQEMRVYECAEYLDSRIDPKNGLWSLDTSSRKGKNIARKDLNEMFEVCKKDKSIRYIIVDEADRFMRSIEEAYWWKVQFKTINVYLAYANMPEITHEDNPMSVMREMMAFFQAEMSNHERITKATEKMQAKIKQGYYPGMVHQGYKKSEVASLHIPREPQWSLLQTVMKKILYEAYSLDDALLWLTDNGYRLLGGRPIDMHKLKRILQEPYYAGIIKMSNWDVICQKGLHQAMITVDEHNRLVEIVSGRRKKFSVKKYNPLFPASNIIVCAECTSEGRRETHLVGYRHHNGKRPEVRKYYERYRCRGCIKNSRKEKIHAGIDRIFDNIELIVDDKGVFLKTMRSAWEASVEDNIQNVRRLKQKLTALEQQKDSLVRSMAINPDLASDFKTSITNIKSEISDVQTQITAAEDIESDFNEFVRFSIDYIDHLKDNWWLSEEVDDRIRLKDMLFLDGLQIHRDGKVKTPSLSPIYRYKSSKKAPESAFFESGITNGGPSGTRTQDTRLKRPLL